MKRNLLLIAAIILALLLAYISTKRIMNFRDNSQSVTQAEKRLEELKKENADLKKELEYKPHTFIEGLEILSNQLKAQR